MRNHHGSVSQDWLPVEERQGCPDEALYDLLRKRCELCERINVRRLQKLPVQI
eukprot:IDg10844t1